MPLLEVLSVIGILKQAAGAFVVGCRAASLWSTLYILTLIGQCRRYEVGRVPRELVRPQLLVRKIEWFVLRNRHILQACLLQDLEYLLMGRGPKFKHAMPYRNIRFDCVRCHKE